MAMIRIKTGMAGMVLALMVALLPIQSASARECERENFERSDFIVCTVEPGTDDLQLFWRGGNNEPFRHFSELANALAREGRQLVFAINAGMYMTDFTPVGLHIEHGRQLRPLNTRTLDGPPAQVPNFYKQPNGVFYIDETGAGVVSTEAFADLDSEVRFATQSGPMLVIENTLHPAFIEGSSDRTRRSGVGVCADGRVRFALSEGGVNFHDFARLFRDHLECPNALFLDGGRGVGIYHPFIGRNDRSWHGGFGAIFGIAE
ncbi:lipoprotein signal peptide [Pelagibacterium lentulum]|uniref:Lipoprotein signal peptide n=2 Tax=Pelagibacterium lentulum TaxID=2029865 RepID=A0A916RB87_9HYPH|nr:lipoprotein signal peptide [Pelagibacterium lentulum]